jgi:ribosomal protein L29
MKMKDIKNKNSKELNTLLSEKQAALQKFRFGIAGSSVRNVREGRGLRKDIAQVRTVLSALKTK